MRSPTATFGIDAAAGAEDHHPPAAVVGDHLERVGRRRAAHPRVDQGQPAELVDDAIRCLVEGHRLAVIVLDQRLEETAPAEGQQDHVLGAVEVGVVGVAEVASAHGASRHPSQAISAAWLLTKVYLKIYFLYHGVRV